MRTNNSNLREATNLSLNRAYVMLGGQAAGGVNIATIEAGHPLNSRTHTDSAGGEAQIFDGDNDIENHKMILNRKASGESQPAMPVPCDQDVPLLPGPGFSQTYGGLKHQ